MAIMQLTPSLSFISSVILCLCVVLLDARPPPQVNPMAYNAIAEGSYRGHRYPQFKGQFRESAMFQHRLNKRAAMSFNNDLTSLAAMMQQSSNRRRLEAAQSFLSAIGKRSAEIAPRVDTYISSPEDIIPQPETRAGPKGLSVGVSLEAIHDMIRAQRRRNSADRAQNAYDRLQIIGKRSVDGLSNDSESELDLRGAL